MSHAETVQKLIDFAQSHGITASDLDDEVYDLKFEEATGINNRGHAEQIKFLYKLRGAKWVRKIIKENDNFKGETDEGTI